MPQHNTLNEWLAWLETLHPAEIELGLSRISSVACTLGFAPLMQPRDESAPVACKLITVAGTNGKGSFVTSCEALFAHAGKTTGAYTSPHILAYNERIRINGAPVSDATIIHAFERIDLARGDLTLTYFEFSTLAAALIFRDAGVDYWLLEVGLGGRLDAVNCFFPDVAVITSIDLDHQNWLGDTREAIAVEKAGIIRSGIPVVCAEPNPPENLPRILPQDTYYIDVAFHVLQEAGRVQFFWTDEDTTNCTSPVECALPLSSVAAALQVFSLDGYAVPGDTLDQTISGLALAGRFQRKFLADGTEIVFDVAHNPAATQLLAKNLAANYEAQKFDALVAMMADKDIAAALQPVLPWVDHWYLLELADIPRAATTEQFRAQLLELGVAPENIYALEHTSDFFSNCDDAGVKVSTQVSAAKRLLVFGSFYTVANVLNEIQ